MKLYIQGCIISTDRSYVRIGYSNEVEFLESYVDNCYYIKVPKGYKWSDLYNKNLKVLKDQVIEETNNIKVPNQIYELNGLKLRKLVHTDYVISQYLIKDIKEYKMLMNETQCQILIPQKSDYEFNKYIALLSQNPYIEVIDYSDLVSLKNFYAVNLSWKSKSLTSSNEFAFNTKKFYTKYILEPIDIQNSFINILKSKLAVYGLDLLRYPIDDNVKTVDHVVWRYTDLNKQETYKSDYYPLNDIFRQVDHCDFELTTPNMVIFNDFKNRYQNIDFLTNWTTFNTLDKIGREWSSSITWQPISTDFNQDYEQDSQGNIAMRASFSADITHYTVYDKTYYDIQKTILSLFDLDTKEFFEEIILE